MAGWGRRGRGGGGLLRRVVSEIWVYSYIFFSLSLIACFFLFFFLHCGHGTDMYINKRYDRSNSELLIYKNDNKNI